VEKTVKVKEKINLFRPRKAGSSLSQEWRRGVKIAILGENQPILYFKLWVCNGSKNGYNTVVIDYCKIINGGGAGLCSNIKCDL